MEGDEESEKKRENLKQTCKKDVDRRGSVEKIERHGKWKQHFGSLLNFRGKAMK